MSRYRDNARGFNNAEVAIFGISVDSTWANLAFRQQIGIDFPILSDFKKQVVGQYGLLDERTGYSRRVTFVIDTEGIVRNIDIDAQALDPNGAIGACRLLKKPA